MLAFFALCGQNRFLFWELLVSIWLPSVSKLVFFYEVIKERIGSPCCYFVFNCSKKKPALKASLNKGKRSVGIVVPLSVCVLGSLRDVCAAVGRDAQVRPVGNLFGQFNNFELLFWSLFNAFWQRARQSIVLAPLLT